MLPEDLRVFRIPPDDFGTILASHWTLLHRFQSILDQFRPAGRITTSEEQPGAYDIILHYITLHYIKLYT